MEVVQLKNKCTRFHSIVGCLMNKPLWPWGNDKESLNTVLDPDGNLKDHRHLIIWYFIIYLETVGHLGSTLLW